MSAGSLAAMPDFRNALESIRLAKEEQGKPAARFETVMAAWWKKNDPGTSDQPPWSDPKFDATAGRRWRRCPATGIGKRATGRLRRDRLVPQGDHLARIVGRQGRRPSSWARSTTATPPSSTASRSARRTTSSPPRGTTRFPPGLLKAGRNVIAVRVLDKSGLGGLRRRRTSSDEARRRAGDSSRSAWRETGRSAPRPR